MSVAGSEQSVRTLPPDEDGPLAESPWSGMTLLAKLDELRRRILYAFWGVVAGMAVAWWYVKPIFAYMQRPILRILEKHHLNAQLVYINPTDPFNLYLKIGAVTGVFLASPWIMLQIWLFIARGLGQRKKYWVLPFLLSTVGLFVAGGAFAYFRVFPVAMEFFISYASAFTPTITVREYTKIFLMVVVGMGLVFEMPVLIFFLSVFGLVSPRFLWRNFRYAILIIFIVAGILTPTNDVSLQFLSAAPMLVLYVLSIGVSWLVHPEQRARRAEAKAARAAQQA